MEIAESLSGRLHFNTFGGNPVSTAAATATLEVMENENTRQTAKTIGEHLKDRLFELQSRHPLIGEVRGLGLILGIELVRDQQSREPARAEADRVVEECRQRGLLLGESGIFGNIIRLTPPMCITRDDADFIVDCLDDVFGSL
jgi:alanine-glyoxylate transaminase/(R)-3-amino-2-methylpropionate-pyruvate transaminase